MNFSFSFYFFWGCSSAGAAALVGGIAGVAIGAGAVAAKRMGDKDKGE